MINQVLLSEFAIRHPVFHGEKDLMEQFAEFLQDKFPSAEVKTKYHSTDKTIHSDILMILDGKYIPIELQYRTASVFAMHGGESFNLKNHGAQPLGCYTHLANIANLEKFKENSPEFSEGYAIFITNDLTYTRDSGIDANYGPFRISEGKLKNGEMGWPDTSFALTDKTYRNPITLKGEYRMHWFDFTTLRVTKSNTNTIFKATITKVE